MSYTSWQTSFPRRHQPAEIRRKGAVLSLACRAMEPGHLLHSALTCPPSRNARRLKSRHPFVPTAQQPISSTDSDNRSLALWADHQWNAVWLRNTTWPCFHPRYRRQLSLNGLAKNSVGPAQTPPHWCQMFALLLAQMDYGPVSVAQKNKPSTMLSSNVQSIDLPMDCTAWRFWMIRQLNGCCTPAPRSRTAK